MHDLPYLSHGASRWIRDTQAIVLDEGWMGRATQHLCHLLLVNEPAGMVLNSVLKNSWAVD